MKRSRILLAAAAVVTVSIVASVSWVFFPRTDRESVTDATFILASAGGAAAVTAGDWDRYPGDIVLSAPEVMRQVPAYKAACSGATARVVACVDPDPSTTRGEARAFAALAKQHGWRSATVVSHRTHMSRSRMLVDRCFDGEVRMRMEDVESGRLLARGYFYEVGALLKATVLTGC